MNYSIIIKRIRDKLFLTQTELAEMLSVSLTTVCRWENKVFEPTMKVK
ncbi:MAG: helix-turn-helix domain-containing protein [Oscillospiraceae bacterium]|nr:helix-turn-helix domain-containing protein [Oscillospiraceae bacterium]